MIQNMKKASSPEEVIEALSGSWFGISVHLWPKMHRSETLIRRDA